MKKDEIANYAGCILMVVLLIATALTIVRFLF